MIPIRVQARIEELAQQYFPSLSITDISLYDEEFDDYDVYIVEMEDGREYWAFDDQQDIFLLNKNGIYADLENAYDALLQMIENSKELQEESQQDRMDLYGNGYSR